MSKNKVLVLLNQSELSHKILPHVERFVSADDNDLILYFVTKPPSAVGFGEPDLAPGYVLPGDSPVTPTLHPIYASQQEDSIRAHVESELIPVVNQLREAGYTVSVDVEFGKDSLEAIYHRHHPFPHGQLMIEVHLLSLFLTCLIFRPYQYALALTLVYR